MSRVWEWVASLTPRLEYVPEDILWDLEYGTGLDIAHAHAEIQGVDAHHLSNATAVYEYVASQ